MSFKVHLVSVLIYFIYFLGLCFCLGNTFEYIKGRVTLRRRLYDLRKKEPGRVRAKLDSLVFMATGKENGGGSLAFLCVLIFSVVFLYLCVSMSVFFSLIIALLAASVPIVSLVSKIQKQRNGSGREGLPFVNELYRQYVTGDRNILTALEGCCGDTSEYPLCGRQAYLLLLRLRSSGDRAYVKRACSDFAGAIGSLWARSLASAFVSAYGGFDISKALLDLLSRLKLMNEGREERKRLNSESSRMTLFLVPAMYLFTLIVSVKVLGLSFSQLLKSQFLDRTGLMFFFSIVILFFVNCMLLSAVNGSSPEY